MTDKDNITQALAAFTDSETLTSVAARGFYEALGVTMKENQRLDDPILIDEEMYKRATDSDRMPAALRQAFSHVTNSYLVGSIDDHNLDNIADDGQTKDMLFFAVDTDRTLNRTDAANLTRLFNRMARKNPVALVIRHADDTIHLALCERTDYVQQWRQGQKIGRVRIMMNINCRKTHRGHIDMLHTIADKQYLTYDELYNHWLHVFSVQTLTRRFYSELQDWYFRAVRVARFPNDVNRSDDYQAHNAEALIRFLTRFIFVWFLKHKGLVNDDLFQEDKLRDILKDFRPQDDNNGQYYNAILQNLFFATLNRKIEERRFIEWFQGRSKEYDIKTFYRCRKLFNDSLTDEEIKTLFNRTPYVNGSLFDCLDNRPAKDAQGNETTISLDGFSNTHADKQGIIKQAFIPNSLFFRPENTDIEVDLRAEYGCTHRVRAVGLINIFNRYYFTVEENTPLDEQIALDPELLGRVFENLLGAFNPETQNNSRNSTGSFYTPREIVEYMCDESLKAYLNTCLPECADSIKALLDGNSETVNPGHREPLMRAIYNCRILDPACGSGAFPMGLLQRLVDCLRLLDPDNSDWREIVEDETIKATARTYRDRQLSEDERQSILDDIAANFNRRTANADFARKLYIIQHSIHGVDIQPIAIMISKLRFFISLLCEQQTNDNPNDNYGILTLPNLETNLVCANSLIVADFKDLIAKDDELRNEKGIALSNDEELSKLREELKTIRQQHFTANTKGKKTELESKDKDKRNEIKEYIEKAANQYDKNKIQQLQQNIALQQKVIDTHQGEKWEERNEEQEQLLFGNNTTPLRKRNIDVNKQARERALSAIQAAQRQIAKLKTIIERRNSAAKQLAEWNPYDPVASAPFFDSQWMFGITTGFNIVIGNPPYGAKYGESDKKYFKENYQTARTITGVQKASLDTFTLFIERGFSLTNEGGCLSMIVPMSFTSSDSMAGVHKMLMSSCKELRVSSYAVRPKPIFENAVVNTSIFRLTKRRGECKHIYSTKMYRKGKGFELQTLMNNLSFVDAKDFMLYGRIPKIGSNTERSVLAKMNERGRALSEFVDSKGKPIYYRTTGGRYFKVVTDYSTGSTKEKPLYFKKDKARTIGCILSSNLAFWFYQVYSNNLDWKSFEILTFRIPELDDKAISRLNALYDEYLSDIERNANVRKTTGTSSYKVESFIEYKIGKSKAIIDRIDDLICPLYGFTQEETDFIKNYEIEFRLSDDE